MRLCWAGLDIQATLPTGRPQMLTRAILAIVQAARTAMTAQNMKRDARINSAFNRLDQLASNVPIATSYACHILINVRDIFRRAGVNERAGTADRPPSAHAATLEIVHAARTRMICPQYEEGPRSKHGSTRPSSPRPARRQHVSFHDRELTAGIGGTCLSGRRLTRFDSTVASSRLERPDRNG